MLTTDYVTQRRGKSNLDMISQAVATGEAIDHLDVAAAYVTTGGVRDLLEGLKLAFGVRWQTTRKRWLIAFDYCRTDPLAVRMLKNEPHSTVKVHDVAGVLTQPQCIPSIPFHPKAFLFRGPNRHAVFAGSGNISRSGLKTGHEVGIFLNCGLPHQANDANTLSHIVAIQDWFNAAWGHAPALLDVHLNAYEQIFNSVPNLIFPLPTDDDPPSPNNGRDSLTTEDLRKLRACSHLWIEAGNITKNRGIALPGNQLMMKRLSRVFFGVPAFDVPQNSPLTQLQISYEGVTKADCSLTFSDNAMDKLTLPIPNAGAATRYDQKTLLFTRVGPGDFLLKSGTKVEIREWLRNSAAINANHKMGASGRRWGVF